MVSEAAALLMAACNVRQAAGPGARQVFESFPAGSTNKSVACADDAPPRRAERATIRQTWRMPNLLPTGPMMPRLVASPRLPRQRAEYGIADPLLPAAFRPSRVPIPAYVQPCSLPQSIVNPSKLPGRVKEAWYADGATRRRVG